MYSRAYKSAVTIPPLLWVTVFLLIPYVILFCYSFWSVSPLQVIVHNWNLHNYAQLFRNPLYLTVLLRSIRIAGAVTLLALLLGYPLAYYLSFHATKRKDLLYQLVIIPLWASYLVRGYAWKTILGSDGVLNGFLQYLHITHRPVGFFLYSPFAVILTSTHLYTPFTILPLRACNFAVVPSRYSRGSYVRLRPHFGRFSRASPRWGFQRHHDFQYCGELVRRRLQLASRRGDFAVHVTAGCKPPVRH